MFRVPRRMRLLVDPMSLSNDYLLGRIEALEERTQAIQEAAQHTLNAATDIYGEILNLIRRADAIEARLRHARIHDPECGSFGCMHCGSRDKGTYMSGCPELGVPFTEEDRCGNADCNNGRFFWMSGPCDCWLSEQDTTP